MADKDDPEKPAPDGAQGESGAKPEAGGGESPASDRAPETPTESSSGAFRAAGDPDEPEPAPDNSPLARLGRWLEALGDSADAFWEKRAAPRLQRLCVKPQRAGGRSAMHHLALFAGWSAGALLAVMLGFFVFVTWGMPSPDDVWEANGGQSITFLDRNGQVILREGAENAPPVDLSSLPAYVPDAFVAIEDRRFYQHFGIDVGGVLRAGATNLRAGRVVQGGSTITQQLAKNLFLTNERSWRRKAQEVALAIWLETKFSKQQLLALYLSRVYFGAGAYGVEAAAERYFDRPARELTLLQAAMLAGLVKAPSRLNPARQDIGAARDRAEVVLNEMVAERYISSAERTAALGEDLVVSQKNPAGVLGYFRDWIDPLLNEVIGIQRDDFIVETTLDIVSHRAGASIVEEVLGEDAQPYDVQQAGLLALDEDGGVLTMVGGRDYDESQFNRTVQARRQPGSSFKFYIYLAAMQNGLTPWTLRADEPITIGDWSPGNYTHEYHGIVPLNEAFAKSYNMVAIRVAQEVGGDNVIDVARQLGVQSELHNYRSLALGAQELTLLENVQSYGAMANEGYQMHAHGVTRIVRPNSNEVMWSWIAPSRDRVIGGRELRYMNYMMSRTVRAGTGTRARIDGWEIGGKTGTGNDYRDAWFVGFTPGFVAGVWMGNDDFTETRRLTGGSLPAEIWRRYAEVALRNMEPRSLQMPSDVDFAMGPPPPATTTMARSAGAPLGATLGPAPEPSPASEDSDLSLDFGPEG